MVITMANLLLVIDMQRDFVDGALGIKEAAEILPKVIQKIKDHQGPIIYTRDTHGEDYLNTQEGKRLPVVHCVKESQGWQLMPELMELADKSGSLVFDKPSFGSLELAAYIKELYKEHQWEEIQLIGLCTDICVVSNGIILKAALPEVTISVDPACCAGVTRESHNHALEVMKMCQIVLSK